MTDTPLQGVGVLVTRPRAQAAELIKAIEDSGGNAVCVPKVDPPADEGGCALAGRPAATGGLLILLLGAWLLLRARRRRP
jgi:hypothetical protein